MWGYSPHREGEGVYKAIKYLLVNDIIFYKARKKRYIYFKSPWKKIEEWGGKLEKWWGFKEWDLAGGEGGISYSLRNISTGISCFT